MKEITFKCDGCGNAINPDEVNTWKVRVVIAGGPNDELSDETKSVLGTEDNETRDRAYDTQRDDICLSCVQNVLRAIGVKLGKG